MAKKFDMKALWAWVIDSNYELKAYLSQGENECQIEMTDCNGGVGIDILLDLRWLNSYYLEGRLQGGLTQLAQ